MKSYNGLFARMIQQEEVEAAIKEAAKKKTKRPVVRRVLARIGGKAKELIAALTAGAWKPPRHSIHTLREGSHKKEREIQKPRWDDEQIVHHLLMRQFREIVYPKLYRYACGSIPRRGAHYVVRQMTRWRDGYQGKKFYVAELDIKKFYDNIDTEILKDLLRKLIRDKLYLWALFLVIDTAAPGLPKGFYTSPWLSHFYLMALDYYIVQVLKPDHYIRLVDNMWLFSTNKKELHEMVRKIEAFLSEKRHLHLKGDWQVFRFEGERRGKKATVKAAATESGRKKVKRPPGRVINAVGFVVHRDRVTIRKSILKRIRAKANRVKRKGHITRKDAGAIVSYMGYFKHTDTHNYYKTWIKPKVSVQYCKRRISKLAKKQQQKGAKKHDRVERGTRQQGRAPGGSGQGHELGGGL